MALTANELAQLIVTVRADTRQYRFNMREVRQDLISTNVAFMAMSRVGMAAWKSLEGAVVGIASSIKKAGDEAANWETKMMKISKTTNIEGKSLRNVSDSLKSMGANMAGIRLDQLADIAKEAGKVGVKAADIESFTKAIALATIAFEDIDAEKVATEAARISTEFGLAIKDVIRLTSAIAKLDIESTATGKDLFLMAEGMGGPAAKVGMTVQETLALAAAMRDAGIKADVGATAFQHFFQTIETAPEVPAAIAEMSTKDFQALLKNKPLEAFGKFLEGIEKFDVPSEFQILKAEKLQGRRTGGTLFQTATVMQKVRDYTKMANNEMANSTTIFRSAGIAAETTNAQWDRMSNIIQNMSISIGNALLPSMKAFADAVGNVAMSVKGFVESNKDSINRWAAAVSDGVTLAGKMIQNLPTIVQIAGLRIKNLLSGATFEDAFVNIAGNLIETIKWGSETAFAALKNVAKGAFDFILDMMKRFDAMFQVIWDNLWRPAGKKLPVPSMGADFGKAMAVLDPLKGTSPFPEMRSVFEPVTGASERTESKIRALELKMIGSGIADEIAKKRARDLLMTPPGGPPEKSTLKPPGLKSLDMDASNRGKASGFIGDLVGFSHYIQQQAFGNAHEKKTEDLLSSIKAATEKTATGVIRIGVAPAIAAP